MEDTVDSLKVEVDDCVMKRVFADAMAEVNISVSLPSGQTVSLSLPQTSIVQDLKIAAQEAFGKKFLRLSRSDGSILEPDSLLSSAGEEVTAVVQLPRMVATEAAFALWCSGGQVVTWGDPVFGGKIPENLLDQLQQVQEIVASFGAFAAILTDGRVAFFSKSCQAFFSLSRFCVNRVFSFCLGIYILFMDLMDMFLFSGNHGFKTVVFLRILDS